MDDNKVRKKRVGTFSVRYLKYLFLKERKEQIPELEEDFRKRRYTEDEFDDEGKVVVQKEDSVPSENFENLKNYVAKRYEEEEEAQRDTATNRISKYRTQLDKYNQDDDASFEREIESLSEQSNNYSAKRSSRRSTRNNNDESLSRKYYSAYTDDDGEDSIDSFLSENTAKEKYSGLISRKKPRKRKIDRYLENEENFLIKDEDIDKADFIDDDYLDSLDDDDFFEKQQSKKNSLSSRFSKLSKSSSQDDLDDFIDKHNK